MTDLAQFLSRVTGTSFAEFCQSVCEELRRCDSRYDWVGIYWVNGDYLDLKAWSGREATEHVRIPISQGICGSAVREEQTIIVDDVNADPRYLACFLDTHSEIVVPIRWRGKVVGEIDIDGRETHAFTDRDRIFLETLADHIGSKWSGAW